MEHNQFPMPDDLQSQLKLQAALMKALSRLSAAIDTGDPDVIQETWRTSDPIVKAYSIIQIQRELSETIGTAERILSITGSTRVGGLVEAFRSLRPEFERLLAELKPALRARIESGIPEWDYVKASKVEKDAAPNVPPTIEKVAVPLTDDEVATARRLLNF